MGRIMLNGRVGCIPRGAIVRYGDRYDCPWTPDPYKIASGIIASFETSLPDSIVECNCNIPYNANGYTNIELSVRGINIWNEIKGNARWKTDGEYSSNSNVISNAQYEPSTEYHEIPCSPNTKYCFVDTLALNKYPGLYIVLYYSKRTSRVSTSPDSVYYGQTQINAQEFTTPTNAYYMRFTTNNAKSHSGANVSINYPSTYQTYYEHKGFNTIVSFGQTIYGGTFETKSGKLTSKYNADGTIKSTPDIIQLTPVPITTLTDEPNNIWTNCGEVEAKYYE